MIEHFWLNTFFPTLLSAMSAEFLELMKIMVYRFRLRELLKRREFAQKHRRWIFLELLMTFPPTHLPNCDICIHRIYVHIYICKLMFTYVYICTHIYTYMYIFQNDSYIYIFPLSNRFIYVYEFRGTHGFYVHIPNVTKLDISATDTSFDVSAKLWYVYM